MSNASPKAAPRRDVLVIDDSPEVIDTVRAALGDECRVLAAIDGEQGMKVAREHQPSLVLVDVLMPGMDGYQVCMELKNDPDTSQIPVIFVTSLDSADDEVRGFAVGAVDFVNKPIAPALLRARVRTHIELACARSELHKSNQYLQTERELIGETLASMRNAHEFCADYLDYVSHTGAQAGGDLVLSARRPDGAQHVLVGDFTGHGLPAAIGTPLVSHLFYSLTEQGQSLGSVLAAINDVLVRQLPVNIFMVAVGLCMGQDSTSMRVWSFGAPDVVVLREDGSWEHKTSLEPPMGILPHTQPYRTSELRLQGNDAAFVMSDGAFETMIDEGEMFGLERLKQALQRHNGQVVATVDELLSKAANGFELDDITLLKVSNSAAAETRMS